MNTPLFLSVIEAARHIGVGRTYLYTLISSGAIRSVRTGRRRLVCTESLRQWAANMSADGLKAAQKDGGAL